MRGYEYAQALWDNMQPPEEPDYDALAEEYASEIMQGCTVTKLEMFKDFLDDTIMEVALEQPYVYGEFTKYLEKLYMEDL